ncbi:MAG: amino-acid acetyltransferase, partial [Phycisphaerales bacterium]
MVVWLHAERADLGQLRRVDPERGAADDLDAICWLVDHWAQHGENLPRSREDILKAILDFGVAVVDGKFDGCAAVWSSPRQVAGSRSRGVHADEQGAGGGGGG